jgi:dCMP deaminase
VGKRLGKDEYYLGIAREVCRRGTCLRRQYGAVIVNDDQIVSTGYAGAPRGVANCVDLGRCLRQELAVPPGQRYELCRSVHAEMNAVIHASRAQTLDRKSVV